MKTRGNTVTMSLDELQSIIRSSRWDGWMACISEFCDEATNLSQERRSRSELELFWKLICMVENGNGFEHTFSRSGSPLEEGSMSSIDEVLHLYSKNDENPF